MGIMLAALSAKEAYIASITARRPNRSCQTMRGDRIIPGKKAGQGRRAGMNPAAVVFGPPGQDMRRRGVVGQVLATNRIEA